MMKLDSGALGLAAAAAVAVLWLLCSLVVVMIPGLAMVMSGYMVHSDLSSMSWDMHLGGFFAGLVIWSAAAGVTAWLVACFYNRLAN